MRIPTFDTDAFLLRALTLSDTVDVFNYASDNRVSALTQWQRHVTLSDSRRFINANQQSMLWGIVDKETNRVIGECGLLHRSATTYEIHCALAQASWGKGIATQAMKLLIAFSFDELKIPTIQSWIIAENSRSIRLAQKLGMHHAMTVPQAWLSDHAMHDLYMFNVER